MRHKAALMLVFASILLLTMLARADEVDEAAKINTDGWTDSPFMTLDGQSLFFMYTPFNFFPLFVENKDPEKRGPDRVEHHADPFGSAWNDSDIYRVERLSDGTWSEPENMGAKINSEDTDDQIWVSPDGQTAYFNRELTLLVMTRLVDGAGWTDPNPVEFVGGRVDGAEASFTRDGKTMILAVPDIAAQRLEIVEYTLQTDGRWGDAKKLD